ncbi:unnamed protein product [Rhodiola kirilowii]
MAIFPSQQCNHILIIPYPSQGHMVALLDLVHRLCTLFNLTITILVTPKNLPALTPLLQLHPTLKTLILPFPSNPSIPLRHRKFQGPSSSFISNCNDGCALEFLPASPLWFRSQPIATCRHFV